MFRFLSKEHVIAQDMYQVSSCCHDDTDDIIVVVIVIRATIDMASKVNQDSGGVSP